MRNIFKEKEFIEDIKLGAKFSLLVMACLPVVYLCAIGMVYILGLANANFWLEVLIVIFGVGISAFITVFTGFVLGYIFHMERW